MDSDKKSEYWPIPLLNFAWNIFVGKILLLWLNVRGVHFIYNLLTETKPLKVPWAIMLEFITQ